MCKHKKSYILMAFYAHKNQIVHIVCSTVEYVSSYTHMRKQSIDIHRYTSIRKPGDGWSCLEVQESPFNSWYPVIQKLPLGAATSSVVATCTGVGALCCRWDTYIFVPVVTEVRDPE